MTDNTTPLAPSSQEAVLAILQDARHRLEAYQRERDETVAIIGMSGRFPGADDIDSFWAMLEAGRTGLRTVTDRELDEAHVGSGDAGRPDYVRVWGGFDDPTGFDAGFFGYSPRDAELMDPQQRVFLECAWSAFEHAGYDSRRFPGRIGVYAGGSLTYNFSHIQGHRALQDSVDPIHTGLSNVIGMIAARVAYHLDLRGPGVGVQATCATSLVSVHLAARSLLARECDMALAGGVAVGQPRPAGYLYKNEGIASPDGQCRPFDAAAQGTVFTNGVGAVVLKRLSDAQADGDTIYAVIRGSAINNDGAARVGLTAPGVAGQAAVLEAALSAAGIEASGIDYVEAHGTATALGDPIELTALNRVYGPSFRANGGTCALGSVKGNIGHMDVAAGIGGLIKTVLALRHRCLPASLNFRNANPACDFAAGPFEIVTEKREWAPRADRPRRAAISSFGMGGTNAHIILEEPPVEAVTGSHEHGNPQLLPISARTPGALDELRRSLADRLAGDTALPLADVAHTLQTGRRPMAHRLIALARDNGSAAAALSGDEGGWQARGEPLGAEPGLVFLFPGQGSQHPGMARALYDREPAFRAAYDDCLASMPAGTDPGALLDPAADADRLNRTETTQPALFVVEYALAQMWLGKGLTPRALLGHSIGEYVAACLAGVFSLKDALKVVCARGRLMQACAPGAMLSVMLSEAEARAALTPGVEIAAVNGPRACVLAGSHEAIAALAEQFDRSGLGSRLLKTSHAFHSAMMEPALAEFATVLESVTLNRPTLDIVSNVTGDWLTAGQATSPGYWVEHMRKPVLFGPGLARLIGMQAPLLLEVGPGSALTRLARQQLRDTGLAVASLPDAGSDADAADHALMAFGRLWIAGLDVDWSRLHADERRRRVGLPTYRFERSSYWIPPAVPGEPRAPVTARKENPEDWFHQPIWRRQPITPAAAQHSDGERWLLLNASAVLEATGPLSANIEVIAVEADEDFENRESFYTLDHAEPEHYRSLMTALAAAGRMPDQVINGFGLSGTNPQAGNAADAAFASTMALGRALVAEEARPPLLTLLGRGMHEIDGSETLDPSMAMLVGLMRVLPQELPGLSCRTIDLPASDLRAATAGLTDLLMSPWSREAAVSALRRGLAWSLGHAATPLSQTSDVPVLERRATYLITGDLVEGPGLIYARALVRALKARLILLGRPGLPPVQDWERWLASHSPQHPVSQFIRALRDIGAPGKDYLLFSGSLSDRNQVDRAVTEGQQLFGDIRGVFDTGGMGEQYHCPLELATPDSYASLFAARISGLQTLEAALASISPAFVLVQSSLSAIVGGAGLAAYAAANSFLNAFVEARRGSAAPVWQAIEWDACLPHTGASGGSGILAGALTPDEVWRATQAVLAQPRLRRVVVTPVDLDVRMTAAMTPQGESPAPAAPDTTAGRRGVGSAYLAPRDAGEAAVAAVMGELLGIERVGVNDNFFELGGHSLLAIQVVTRLRKQFGIELPMRTLLFEAPTVGGIAAVIRDALAAAERERETLAALLDDIEMTGAQREA